MSPTWRAGARTIDVGRPVVVGILNVTPDSFSDGGLHVTQQAALARVERMVAEGADVVDVGGESTRPQGAESVSEAEELRRVVPVVRVVRGTYPDLPVSVDTTKSAVAAAAIEAGADIVNDVSAFRLDPRMREIVASTGAGVILMHSRGGVAEMGTYRHAHYGEDVVGEIISELDRSVGEATAAGVAREAIVVDPGIGFAKRSEHSVRVIAELGRVAAMQYPVLVGVSRKRFVGELARVERPTDRVAGSVGANVAALERGARLFRVHDVAPSRQALDVAWAILRADRAHRAPALDFDAGERSASPMPDTR